MNTTVSLGAIFLEGLLSFFSPCVLPLIPLYFGYLTVGAKSTNAEGQVVYKRSKVFITTLFFVLGICCVFFILGLGTSAFRSFFTSNGLILTIIGAIILLLLGLTQIGWIQIPFLQKEHRLSARFDTSHMGFLKAFLMGFFFSFAWTPCIGPMLSSALVLSANASSALQGNLYILAYSLGFVVCFLLLGIFTEELLNLLKKHQEVMKVSTLVGGILILCMSVWMFYDGFHQVAVLTSTTNKETVSDTSAEVDQAPDVNVNNSGSSVMDGSSSAATDIEKHSFALQGNDGQVHSLKDFLGKRVIITFFGTWCGYCQKELPILQNLNDTLTDTQVILLARPNDGSEGDIASIDSFMEKNGYSMLVLYDTSYEVFDYYGINGFPTTYIYGSDGSLFGYQPGYLEEDQFENILENLK